MRVPASCSEWRSRMDQGGLARHILRNVERDGCLPSDVEATFFERLAAKGPFATPEAARNAAQAVIREDPDAFYCKGKPIADGAFVSLVRFVMVGALKGLIPESGRGFLIGLNTRFAVSGPNWPNKLPDVQKHALCAALTRELQIGQLAGVAWVCDSDVTPWNGKELRQLLRCLGIREFEVETWTLVLHYNRVAVLGGLYVPRALDAMWSPAFWVQEDCAAPAGVTKPTDEAGPDATGYPEAIHRSDVILVQSVHLKAIDDDAFPNISTVGSAAGLA